MFKIFLNSLKGRALSWFTRLHPYSVDCFKTLVNLFKAQFAASIPYHLTSMSLVNLRQEKTETLRVFMERFGNLTLQIRYLNPEVALHHLVTGLKPGPFADDLCIRPAYSLEEIKRRSTKFMQIEEVREFKNPLRADSFQEKVKPRENRHPPLTYVKTREVRMPRFQQYTSLTANRGQILEEALHASLLSTPRRGTTPRNADTSKYCRFHQNYGHTTEDCTTVKDKIEELS